MLQYTYGYNMTVDTGMDLSQATNVLVCIVRPDGTHIHRYLANGDVIIMDAARGKVAVPVKQGDLTMTKQYIIQVYDISSGKLIASNTSRFFVEPLVGGATPDRHENVVN